MIHYWTASHQVAEPNVSLLCAERVQILTLFPKRNSSENPSDSVNTRNFLITALSSSLDGLQTPED